MSKVQGDLLSSVQRAPMVVELKYPIVVKHIQPRCTRKKERSPIRLGQVRHAQNPNVPPETFCVARCRVGTVTRDCNPSHALEAGCLEMRSPFGSYVVAEYTLRTEGVDYCRRTWRHQNLKDMTASINS